MNKGPHNTFGVLARTLLLGAALACPYAAQAVITEADFLDEMPVVLSVSRMSQPLNEAPAAVTIIDREMIRASGFRDIPDLLRLVPGFSVAYTRDNTWAIGYHGMADAFSRRFQVLVDGRSFYSAAYGVVNWGELPLSIDDIERIEVVRGPNAATFGANAFFAVINIITKEAVQVPGTFASLQYGEQGMAGVTLRHGGGEGNLNYRLTFSAQNRDRFETDVVDGTATGKLFEESRTYFLNGRADYRLSATDELSAQFGASVGDWQAGRLYSPPRPNHFLEPRQQDVDTQYAQLKFRRALGVDDEWSLQFYHSRHNVDAPASAMLPGLTIIGDQDALQTRTNLEFQANTRIAPDVRMAWGAELRRETVQSALYFDTDDTRQGVLGRVNANLEWRARPDLLLQGGAMLEHHYYTGFNVSPRLAVNYDLAPDHTLRLNVSQAYRTPTFLEQDGHYVYRSTTGLPVDIIGVSPNDLLPERIRSHEIGYVGRYRPWHLQLDAKLFHDKVDDYIGTALTTLPVGAELISGGKPGSARQVVNGGSLTLRGGDLQLNWQPTPAFRLSVQYARVFISTSSELDLMDDDVTDSAPRDSFSLLARHDLGQGWTASAGVYHSGRMIWLGDGDPTPAFTRVDVRLARRWNWQGHEVEAALVGQNLGEDYSEFREENTFSRRVYGSLSFGW
ncbi:MAG: TonB-dependent receptor [Thiobacillus sp.]|nr:TonB-dependent receptor [Thiobacillus sp.]